MAKPKPMCILYGCKGAPGEWGPCAPHLDHIRQYGEPADLMRLYGDAWARFWAKITKSTESSDRRPDLGPCWLWTGSTTDGYGSMAPVRRDGRIYYLAHRLTYEVTNGLVSPGLELDHLCRNRACANPAHLEPVTGRENQERGNGIGSRYKRTGMCDKGHSLEDAYVLPDGTRECRTCGRERLTERYRDPADRLHRWNNPAKYRKLTVAQHAEIRRLHFEQGLSQSEIAAIIGCSTASVSRVVRNQLKGTQPILN